MIQNQRSIRGVGSVGSGAETFNDRRPGLPRPPDRDRRLIRRRRSLQHVVHIRRTLGEAKPVVEMVTCLKVNATLAEQTADRAQRYGGQESRGKHFPAPLLTSAIDVKVVFVTRPPLRLDVDNVAKPLLDSLKGLSTPTTRRYARSKCWGCPACSSRRTICRTSRGGSRARSWHVDACYTQERRRSSRFFKHGRIAQLGERGPYKAEVAGSIPAPPTT